MTHNTILVVLWVTALLATTLASPIDKKTDNSAKELRLTLTPGSTTLLASWKVTLPRANVVWQDQEGNAGSHVLHGASELHITDLKPLSIVTVSVYANDDNQATATAIASTLAQGLQLSLSAGAGTIFAQWKVTFPRVTVVWKDDCGGGGEKVLYHSSEAVITYVRPCTTVTVSVYPDGPDSSPAATEITRTLTKAPPKVNNLKIFETSDQEVPLAWERPDTKCPIAVYIINYSGVARNEPHTEHTGSATIDDGDVTSYIIGGLQPDTDYDMEVVAGTAAGQGKGAYIRATTAEGVPSRPTELKSTSRSSNSITLSWEKPNKTNGVLLNYHVSWYEDGSVVDDAYTPHHIHSIVGLSPCVEYRVRVAASTTAGEGEHEEVTQITAPDSPKVLNSFCSVAPDTQVVTVTWYKPASTCLITGYELFWQIEPEQSFASINALTAGPSPNYTAKMPSEQHSTVCVAAKTREERGQRACCVEIVLPKPSGDTSWYQTSLWFGISTIIVVVVLVLSVMVWKKFFAHRQQMNREWVAIEGRAPIESASSAQLTSWSIFPCKD